MRGHEIFPQGLPRPRTEGGWQPSESRVGVRDDERGEVGAGTAVRDNERGKTVPRPAHQASFVDVIPAVQSSNGISKKKPGHSVGSNRAWGSRSAGARSNVNRFT